MIIVATVGRCGSSLVVEYCKRIGLNCGDVSMIPAYDAGNEAKEVTNLNAHLIKNWRDGGPLRHKKIKEAIQRIDLDVIKDPQFLQVPEIISIWHQYKPDIQVLFLTREPLEILQSLKRLPYMNGPNYRHYTELILSHEDQFTTILCNRGIVWNLFRFPLLLDQISLPSWIEEITGKSNFMTWRQLVDKSKVHV